MIKAYSINKFYECRVTGACLVETEFQFEGRPLNTGLLPFSKPENAIAYIDKEARDWFLPHLENFVNHKKHIITEKHPEQFKVLQTCENALLHYEKMATNTICSKFLAGFKYFEGILPHPHNNSYESSAAHLWELKKFCENFLKFKPLQK
jgi:hypothetical protein